LLPGENEALKKSATHSVIPTNFFRKFNATDSSSSESWDPVPLTLCKSLDPSFRWDDEHLAIPVTRAEIFSGQQWAKAGIHASYWRWIPAFAGMIVR
jgi:hypothetical protein